MNYLKYISNIFLYIFFIGNNAGASTDLVATRSVVKEWVEAEKALADERIAWRAERQILKDLTDLKIKELIGLRTSIAAIAENATQEDIVRSKLVQQRDELEMHRSAIAQFLDGIAPTILAFKAWIPEPLQAQLNPLFKKISDLDAPAPTGLAEAMQATVTILQALNQFDQTVTVHSSLRTLDSGQQVEVETIYVGLGIAYYRSLSGLLAGYGQPSRTGWNWTTQVELAPAIEAALAVANQQAQAAEFIQLPIKISEE